MSQKFSRGISSAGANDVALPNVANAIAPQAIRIAAGIHVATLPTCCSHFPAEKPKMLRKVVAHTKPSTNDDRVDAAVGEALGAERDQRVRGREQQQRREVEEVVDPHAPAAHEPVHGPERAPRPRVDAALFRMLAGQFGEHRGEGHEEQQAGEDPERHRRRADAGAARDPAEADDGDDVHRHDVPQGEGRDEAGDPSWSCWSGARLARGFRAHDLAIDEGLHLLERRLPSRGP